MDGIEKITARITADTRAEIEELQANAKAEAEEIMAVAQDQANAITAELAIRGRQAATEREERMASVAQLETRKAALAAKQSTLTKAFDLALDKLCSMDEKAYIDLLANMLVKASRTGREQVVFNQKDRTRVGKEAVTRANEMLTKANGHKTATERSGSKVSELVNKVVNGVSAITQSSDMLTLAEESRNIKGGFILIDGKVETNCAFETLVRLEKNNMAGEVAKLLFA